MSDDDDKVDDADDVDGDAPDRNIIVMIIRIHDTCNPIIIPPRSTVQTNR